jgi:uncharacterized protein
MLIESAFINQIAQETKISPKMVSAVADLLASNNTIPFIARYRKEATGNLDEIQIRTIDERLSYLRDLHERRESILKSIESQGKLSDDLRQKIEACLTKNALEDLYLPFKPKRRTRASIAREKGLEPLAQRIIEQALDGSADAEAAVFIDAEKDLGSLALVWQGARDIVAEIIAENAEIRSMIREAFKSVGILVSKVRDSVKEPSKFEQYYDFKEAIKTIPSHRFLAIVRGEREDVLFMNLEIDKEPIIKKMEELCHLKTASPFAEQLIMAVEESYKRLLAPSIETDIRVELKVKSDREAVEIFAQNLRNILLAPPLGGKNVIGIDPGLRTGCKCAAVNETGKFIDNITIYLSRGEASMHLAEKELLSFIEKHQPIAIAVGNGTGGRETESFVKELLAKHHKKDIIVVAVSEAGASVYSASEVAREEFPELDLTIRGAISIARRLQDPLAELVKVEPKALGVGQYQHDVFQPLLESKLGEVVESCVNQVGVELNTASAPLLSYVAGIGPSLAKNIVSHREINGSFTSRRELYEVAGIGPRTFEQAAGFLRIRNAKNQLDSSAVHPERYPLVEKIAKDHGMSIDELIGDQSRVNTINYSQYQDSSVGLLTLKDIIDELKKPGRDPRSQFERPAFRDDVNSIGDLKVGMTLEGIVTNVTAFGAFVDIGVHQDGLVHISQLSDRFVDDPAKVVRTGDKISVRVLEVDAPKKRISLTARKESVPKKNNNSVAAKKPESKATLGNLGTFSRLFNNKDK